MPRLPPIPAYWGLEAEDFGYADRHNRALILSLCIALEFVCALLLLQYGLFREYVLREQARGAADREVRAVYLGSALDA